MPKDTGIKNNEEYLLRVLREDKNRARKGAYGDYISSLNELVTLTNKIYKEDNGVLNKNSYQNLVDIYMDVAQKGEECKEKGESKARKHVINHIHKIISKDLKALRNMDKENPGKLNDAFEKSRAIKVQIPDDLTHRVGGQMSDRFPMISKNGDRGYFTARSTTAQDAKWEVFLESVNKIPVNNEQRDKINQLKTDHKLREDLLYDIKSRSTQNHVYQSVAVSLGLSESIDDATLLLDRDENLYTAIDRIVTDGLKLLYPYNMADRLGYDPYTRNDNKNAAMYEVAKFLGCEKLVAKAVPMVVVSGNKVLKGTFMEEAKGSDLNNLDEDDELFEYNSMTSPYNEDLCRDLADMQVLDYICGNIDRHKGNMIYKTSDDGKGNVKLSGLIGIDNDASFPEKNIEEREFDPERVGNPKIFKPQNFRYINKKTADIIRNMKRAQLSTILRGNNISEVAINKAWERTQEVQAVLKNMEMNDLHYTEELKGKISNKRDSKYNPFTMNRQNESGPSIFSGFDVQIGGFVEEEKQSRMWKVKDIGGKGQNVPKGEEVSREKAFLVYCDKIERMDALLKKVNRLKSPSKEFAQMRDTMNELSQFSKDISKKVKDGDFISDIEMNDYETRLNELNKATKTYIEAKSLAPKTGKGQERRDAAQRIENRVEDLLGSLEADKKLDSMQDDMESSIFGY